MAITDNVAEFWHSSFRHEFPESKIVRPNGLTTTDLMHFGWNIAKPFHKSGSHIAVFLKSVFADTFSNTEVYTIERKLRSNPNTGIIKINADICGPTPTPKTVRHKGKQSQTDAKEAALIDMIDDGYIENGLMDDEIVA